MASRWTGRLSRTSVVQNGYQPNILSIHGVPITKTSVNVVLRALHATKAATMEAGICGRLHTTSMCQLGYATAGITSAASTLVGTNCKALQRIAGILIWP